MSNVEDSPLKNISVLGSALSTSTSSFEVLTSHDPKLSPLAKNMCERSVDYLTGEFNSILDEYDTLKDMNCLSLSKYSDIHRFIENLSVNISNLNLMYDTVNPYMEKIDNLEMSITKLEKITHTMEAYSKRLEAKYNCLTKL